MLTNADIKLIRSLSKSKERNHHQLFVGEGLKLIRELVGHFSIELLVATKELLDELSLTFQTLPSALRPRRIEVVPDGFDFTRISSLKQPQSLLALFRMPNIEETYLPTEGLSLLLDEVQDPGNMGTILRTADWFGVKHVYLTSGCADIYSSKVVQATMGALARVSVYRLHTPDTFLDGFSGRVLGTFLDGGSLYDIECPKADTPLLLVMGNEGRGISPEVEQRVNERILIPPYPADEEHTESLNVAIATAICLSELRRHFEPLSL